MAGDGPTHESALSRFQRTFVLGLCLSLLLLAIKWITRDDPANHGLSDEEVVMRDNGSIIYDQPWKWLLKHELLLSLSTSSRVVTNEHLIDLGIPAGLALLQDADQATSKAWRQWHTVAEQTLRHALIATGDWDCLKSEETQRKPPDWWLVLGAAAKFLKTEDEKAARDFEPLALALVLDRVLDDPRLAVLRTRGLGFFWHQSLAEDNGNVMRQRCLLTALLFERAAALSDLELASLWFHLTRDLDDSDLGLLQDL